MGNQKNNKDKIIKWLIVAVVVLLILVILIAVYSIHMMNEHVDNTTATAVKNSEKNELAKGTEEIPQEQTIEYNDYTNARFGYSVSVPDFFDPQREADNGDGRKFISDDGAAVITVYGSNTPMNFDLTTIEELLEYQKVYLNYVPEYTHLDNRWFVLSGTLGGNIIYQKHFLKSDGTENVLIIEYPVSQKEYYDEIVQKIAGSFVTGVGAQSQIED